MTRPFLFDAVLFDLDGTLIATDRFWIEAAERGGRRAFAQLGLERPLPTATEWMSLVGTPVEVGFRRLFPDLTDAQRGVILRACCDEELAALERDGAPSMPGAHDVLGRLLEAGVHLGIASNCTREYLDRMLVSLGIRSLVGGAYCAESPGITSKADMIERLLVDLEASAAVMVGDRASDRDAAWDNGLPHVHCAFGFAQGDESVESEGRIESLGELEALLRRRETWIEGLLGELQLFERPAQRVGITGPRAVGKTLFARDAARLLRAAGRPAEVLALDSFASGCEPQVGEPDPLAVAVDLERLQAQVLAPHERGQAFELPDGRRVEPGTTLLLEGGLLLGSRRRASLDALLLLEAEPAVRLRRLRGRDRRRGPGPLPPADALESPLDVLGRDLERRFPPEANGTVVLDVSSPLGPPPGGPETTAASPLSVLHPRPAPGPGLVRK
jgi:phosphoglycolate phosphatase